MCLCLCVCVCVFVCVCVCVCVFVFVFALCVCVCACVLARMRVGVRACSCARASVHACVSQSVSQSFSQSCLSSAFIRLSFLLSSFRSVPAPFFLMVSSCLSLDSLAFLIFSAFSLSGWLQFTLARLQHCYNAARAWQGSSGSGFQFPRFHCCTW